MEAHSKPANEGKDLLVPLTASLYVPGKVVDHNKVMVDVGTGYFVEKSAADADKFFEKKTETLKNSMVELEKIVTQKTSNLRVIETELNRKIQESKKSEKK